MEQKMELKEKKNIKWLKVLSNIFFTITMIIIIGLIMITAKSRYTEMEPKILGHRAYIVDSGSMSPTINTDSMIIVKELKANEVKVKDIIIYYGHNNQSRVTHRVIGIENNGEFFTTQGDANNSPDPMPLDGEKLIGKVVFKIPKIGKLFRFLNTKMGIVVLVVVSVLWMIIPVISRQFKRNTNI